MGLGTGSTVNYMLEELGKRIREERLKIAGISTSIQTTKLAIEYGIPLTTLSEHPKIDIAIDVADQVDSKLDLIKGMGGALTKEKIVDGVAEILTIIVDESKVTQKLGLNQVVPIEVIPFALTPVMNRLEKLGEPSIRFSKDRKRYFQTENGNYIIDVNFGAIEDAKRLESEIKMISGVVENGLFVNMAKIVFIGNKNSVKKIEKRSK